MSSDSMIKTINEAIDEAWLFDRWPYQCEADFKHELFYRLWKKKYKSDVLGKKSKENLTCHLHSEAKAQNGLKGKKADILICEPSSLDSFNYEVKHVLELKLKLTRSELEKELEKINIYNKTFDSYWIISGAKNKNQVFEKYIARHASKYLFIKTPGDELNKIYSLSGQALSLENAYETVVGCIEKTLNIYGAGKQQFNSFFWCNYEDEVHRGHSFPSEGDFNAHLYSELREILPESVVIRSEYNVDGKSIDLVVHDNNREWAIPIEVKMNWEQFKKKYNKEKKLKLSEAKLIMSRFKLIQKKYELIKPILVVIQGEWRINNKNKTVGNDNKSYAVADLEKHKGFFDFFCYNETAEKIVTNW